LPHERPGWPVAPAACDALRQLVTDEVVMAVIESMTAPQAAHLFVQDLVEQYVNDAGEAAMRLTARGQQVANQAAMTSEDDAAALLDAQG
jgi:hypothetical protein